MYSCHIWDADMYRHYCYGHCRDEKGEQVAASSKSNKLTVGHTD